MGFVDQERLKSKQRQLRAEFTAAIAAADRHITPLPNEGVVNRYDATDRHVGCERYRSGHDRERPSTGGCTDERIAGT